MSVPSHVPAELVREFDFFAAPELASAPHREMRRFHRDAPGIFYTPLNGGHWVVTRSAGAVEMLRKPALFWRDTKHNEANRRWPRSDPNPYNSTEQHRKSVVGEKNASETEGFCGVKSQYK